MKLHKNNRDKWIDFVTYHINESDIQMPFIQNKENHSKIITCLTFEIVKSKLKKSNRKFVNGISSKKFNSFLVDSYERAMAQFNMYCYRNNIKCDIGYLYIIGNESFPGYYKIGCSKDAEGRLNSYQTSSPFRDYYLIKYLINENYKLTEKYTLSYLNNILFNGEWIKHENPDDIFREICIHLSGSCNINNRFSKKANNLFYDRFNFLIKTNFNSADIYNYRFKDLLNDISV